MNVKSVSLLTTRWGAAATPAVTAAAMCVSAAPAQANVGQGGAPAPHAAVVAATGGFSWSDDDWSSGRWSSGRWSSADWS